MKRIFVPAFAASVKDQSSRLATHLKFAIGAMVGKRNYQSPNPSLVMDHGWVWRWVRDVLTWIGLTLRVLLGLAGIFVVVVMIPVLVLIRLVAIPLVAAAHAAYLWFALRKAVRVSKDAEA